MKSLSVLGERRFVSVHSFLDCTAYGAHNSFARIPLTRAGCVRSATTLAALSMGSAGPGMQAYSPDDLEAMRDIMGDMDMDDMGDMMGDYGGGLDGGFEF